MTEKKVVLICDDDYTTAYSVKLMLEKMGYQIDIAGNAKEAENFLATKKYNFMVLDIILPDKNGLILLDEIKQNENTKDLPVIILSALDEKKIDKNIEQKIDYWLEKSFDFSALENLVNNINKAKKTNKVKILHLEDDSDLSSIISMTLENIAEISSVENLTQAEKVLSENVFDVIILDYKLSDGTCEKIVDDIKFTHNKNANLILFSAFEPRKELARKFDKIILKSTVSYEQFLDCIKPFINK